MGPFLCSCSGDQSTLVIPPVNSTLRKELPIGVITDSLSSRRDVVEYLVPSRRRSSLVSIPRAVEIDRAAVALDISKLPASRDVSSPRATKILEISMWPRKSLKLVSNGVEILRRDSASPVRVVSFVGPSGSGKSSLANRILASSTFSAGRATSGVDIASSLNSVDFFDDDRPPDAKSYKMAFLDVQGFSPDGEDRHGVLTLPLLCSTSIVCVLRGHMPHTDVARQLSSLMAPLSRLVSFKRRAILGHLHLVFTDWPSSAPNAAQYRSSLLSESESVRSLIKGYASVQFHVLPSAMASPRNVVLSSLTPHLSHGLGSETSREYRHAVDELVRCLVTTCDLSADTPISSRNFTGAYYADCLAGVLPLISTSEVIPEEGWAKVLQDAWEGECARQTGGLVASLKPSLELPTSPSFLKKDLKHVAEHVRATFQDRVSGCPVYVQIRYAQQLRSALEQFESTTLERNADLLYTELRKIALKVEQAALNACRQMYLPLPASENIEALADKILDGSVEEAIEGSRVLKYKEINAAIAAKVEPLRTMITNILRTGLFPPASPNSSDHIPDFNLAEVRSSRVSSTASSGITLGRRSTVMSTTSSLSQGPVTTASSASSASTFSSLIMRARRRSISAPYDTTIPVQLSAGAPSGEDSSYIPTYSLDTTLSQSTKTLPAESSPSQSRRSSSSIVSPPVSVASHHRRDFDTRDPADALAQPLTSPYTSIRPQSLPTYLPTSIPSPSLLSTTTSLRPLPLSPSSSYTTDRTPLPVPLGLDRSPMRTFTPCLSPIPSSPGSEDHLASKVVRSSSNGSTGSSARLSSSPHTPPLRSDATPPVSGSAPHLEAAKGGDVLSGV